MGIEREICRVDDKLYIRAIGESGEIQNKEVILKKKQFKGTPENVSVSVGVTINPKEFEAIKINYACTIHHQPGLEFRDQAFDVAKFHCLERLVDDVQDLHSNGIIQDHFLLDSADEVEEDFTLEDGVSGVDCQEIDNE